MIILWKGETFKKEVQVWKDIRGTRRKKLSG